MNDTTTPARPASYTDPEKVTEVRITPVPRKGQTLSGYGPALPTRWLVRYAGEWRRIKVMRYGNAGSAYIKVDGHDLFLDSDTEHWLEELTCEGHTSTNGPIGNVEFCDGSCLNGTQEARR